MNDVSDHRGTGNIGSTLTGVAIGAVIGAGVALLLAPDSGKRTRQRLASTARHLGESAGHAIEQARETVVELGADARSAVKAGQEAFVHDRELRVHRTNGRASHPGNATVRRGAVDYAGGERSR
jgi:gas vesicle protein